MLKGLYAAATGILAVESRQDAIANNIANAATVGFRRQEPTQKGFYDVFSDKLVRPIRFNMNAAPGGGVKLDETFTDVRSGALSVTDNPLNVALMGSGFMAIDTPKGVRYTRAGNFIADADKQLATADGFKVQNAGGGAIDVSGSEITITGDGTVNVDGATTGRLQLVEFADPHMLAREGQNLYSASEAAQKQSADATNTTVAQKALEMSNVNLPKEMVGMILALRAYGANQKVVNAVDETITKLIDQVGTPV